ncbi:hypothetical protein BDN67DRAFT_910177, partial [Paxillus ammoniavirescens]
IGKYDHIPTLTGAENYHACTGTDPLDLLDFASIKPLPAIITQPTEVETLAIRKWLVDDIKMKGFIHCFLSTLIHQIGPNDQATTAHAIWDIIGQHYGRKDLITQFVIHKQLAALRIKDASDVSCYVGKHLSLRCHLLKMGANFSKEELAFQLLTGLPQTSEWRMFKSQVEQHLHDAYSRTIITSVFNNGGFISATFQHNPMTSESCLTCIYEYTHMVSTSSSAPADVNPITGLHKYAKNPQGIFCTTPVCSANRRGDHDQLHCFSLGGGMESQAPWQKKKKKDGALSLGTLTPPMSGTSTPVVSSSPLPAVSAAAMTSAFASAAEDAKALLGDLSCASIEPLGPGMPSPELAAHIHSLLLTILDSGTTTTLVHDYSHFWSFSQDSSSTVCMANHGFLTTSSHGDCMAVLTVGDVKCCVCLSNCLYTPDVMLNLLSVGWMLGKGWECNFKGNPSHCNLVYQGHALSSLPLSGNLCFIDLEFLPPL